eukprot:scaffold622_cov102-Cylindrotheca_fusiformis.AAC.6
MMKAGRFAVALGAFLSHKCLAFMPGAVLIDRLPVPHSHRLATQLLKSDASSQIDTDMISVFLPEDLEENEDGWRYKAAKNLKKFGVVALRSSSEAGLMDAKVCDSANAAATTRLEEMQRRIESRGLDPTGVDETFRFSEVVSRDEGGKRFDLPVGWLGMEESSPKAANCVGSGRIGTPLQPSEEDAIGALHAGVDDIARPVVDALWSQQLDSYVAAAGFLINRPGSKSQHWHRDGPDEGFVDCFVPLVDLDDSLGPTALKAGSHNNEEACDEEENLVIPLLRKGEMLLFDYRTLHRGQGNTSSKTTRTLAYSVYSRRSGGSSNDCCGDIHNYPAALTLEYD